VRVTGALLCLAISGCRWLHAGNAAELSPVAAPGMRRVEVCAVRPCRDSLDVMALGVSGYLFMGWRDTSRLVMTPPAFRNPSIWRVLFGDFFAGTRPDTSRIARRMAAMPTAIAGRLQRVGPVLAGHGHYDHLMDLPPLLRRMPNARVYGSATVVNLLAGDPTLRHRTENIDTLAARDSMHVGAWTAAGPWRFKAVTWEHSRNFPGVTYAPGHVKEPGNGLPRTAAGWKMGRVYAYALDLLADDGSVACRMILNDAAASPRVVAHASALWAREARARATVSIISAANYDRVRAYPDSLLSLLRPQHVVLGHWEEFFRSPEKDWKRVRGIVGTDLRRRVEAKVDTAWTALEPGAMLRVAC
jgi:Beta-lactamase superfamily domain